MLTSSLPEVSWSYCWKQLSRWANHAITGEQIFASKNLSIQSWTNVAFYLHCSYQRLVFSEGDGMLVTDGMNTKCACAAELEWSHQPKKNGRCSSTSCRILQRYDICAEVQTAKILVLSKSGMVSVNVTGTTLEEMAGVEATDETGPDFPSQVYQVVVQQGQ